MFKSDRLLVAAFFVPSAAIADEWTVMLQCMQKSVDETKALCQGDALCLKESKTYFHLTPGDIAAGVCGPLSYDIVRHRPPSLLRRRHGEG